MEITEVRIKLMDDPGDRLKAFCSITFDNCFVVRDLKIIEGSSGSFVAMPSRKLTAHCPQCGMKNHLRATHCNQCGSKLPQDNLPQDSDGRAKLYADIAHPINSSCREMIQARVVREFEQELKLAEKPNYVSRYDDFDVDDRQPSTENNSPAEKKTQTESKPNSEGLSQQELRLDPAHSSAGKSHESGGQTQSSSTSDTTSNKEDKTSVSGNSTRGFGDGIF